MIYGRQNKLIIYSIKHLSIGKMLPTSSKKFNNGYCWWKLIMSAWSYENGLAIPETQSKREFTGGLASFIRGRLR
jgi:hypothetical protein